MKKFYLLTGMLCFLIIFHYKSEAQVKIGGIPGPPVSSAVLELDGGGTKALRLPIVNSKSELSGIPNPVNGLIVYSTHTHSIHVYTNGFWTELKETPATFFDLPHYGDYFAPGISVLKVRNATIDGIGLAGEGTLRGIEGQSLNGTGVSGVSEFGTGIYGSSPGNVGIRANTNTGSALWATATSGTALLANVTNGTAFKGYATAGTTVFLNHASTFGKALIVDTGRIGVGTFTPSGMVDIDNTKFPTITNLSLNGAYPVMGFRVNGSWKSEIGQDDNNMVMGTLAGNATGKFIVQTNGSYKFQVDASGRTSIGNAAEALGGMVNINSSIVGPTIVLNAAAPAIAIRTSNIDRAFINWDNGLELGTLSTTNLSFKTNNQSRLAIAGSNGFAVFNNRLGIGATPLTGKLVVNAIGDGVSETITVDDENLVIQLKQSGVNKGFLQVVTDDVKLGLSATNTLGKLILRTGGLDRVFLDNSGNMSIGTEAVAAGYRLNVRGRIMGEEIRIQALANWPDYVFDPGYKLRPLKEVADHIQTYNHLPGIPAADEVANQGFDMGEMQAKLLEKIEELTLYLLEANNRIDQLEKTIAQPKRLNKKHKEQK